VATKKTSTQQSSFLRHELPQMPEGYYSSGPNPNLRRFVEEHATPCSPVTDAYKVKDFSAELKGNRHSSVYNFLGYSSKKPYEPIGKYIHHFTDVGDLILDPFCGSGGVGFVAGKLGRSIVLIDSSPLVLQRDFTLVD